MSRLWLPERGLKRWKPPLGAEVDWGHPLARGLVAGWLFNDGAGSLIDITRGGNDGTPFTTGGIAYAVSPFGQCKDFTGSTNYYEVPYNSRIQLANSFTVLGWTKFASGIATNSAAISMSQTTPTRCNYRIYWNSGVRFYIHDGTVYPYGAKTATLDDKWHQFVGVRDVAADTLQVFIDSVPGTATTDTTTATIVCGDGSALNYTIGVQGASLSYVWDAPIDHIFLFNRALSRGEITEFNAEPFAFLRVPRRRTYFVVTGGGAAPLVGSSAGTSTAAGALIVARKLIGSSAATSTAAGTSQVARKLIGASDSTSTAAGVLQVARKLIGSSAATSTAAGVLETGGYFDAHVYAVRFGVADAVADKSGCDIDPVTRSLVSVRNNGIYFRKFGLAGNLIVQSSALGTPFNDSEDICHTGGSHPDGDWAVINEQPYGSSKLLLFDYALGDTGMPSPIVQYDMSDITGEDSGNGLGTEMVTYDSVRDKFYVGMQSMDIGGLWEVDVEAEPLTVTKLFDWSTVTAQGYGDSTWRASSCCHGRRVGRPNSIFVLINNSAFTANTIIEVDYSGTVLSYLSGPGNKAEGFCFDSSAPYDLFIVADNATGNTLWRYSTELSMYLYGSSAGTSTAAGLAKVARKLIGASDAVSTAAGVLIVARKLIGSSAGTSTAGGVLSTGGEAPLVGASAATSTAEGAIKVARKLIGSSAGASTAAGVIAIARKLIGSSAGTSTATGISQVARKLIGSSAATSTAEGTISSEGEALLHGSSAGTSTATGAIKVARKLIASSAATSTAAGVLTAGGEEPLVGSSAGTSTAAGVLKVDRKCIGSSAATSTALGAIKCDRGLVAISAGISTASGRLISQMRFIGTAASVSLALAHMTALLALKGTSAGTSTASGIIAAYFVPVVRRTWVARRAIHDWEARTQLEWEAKT